MKKINLVKSLTNLVNNRKGLLILCLSLATLGVNEAWGQTYNGGTWYSAYDGNDYSKSTNTGGTIFTLSNVFSPTNGYVYLDTYMTATTNSTLTGVKPKEGYSISIGDANLNVSKDDALSVIGTSGSGVSKKYTYSYLTNRSTSGFAENAATSINVDYKYVLNNAARTIYVKNVKIPLAKHILLDNGTTYGTKTDTKTFANTGVEKTSDAISINLRSFLTKGNITVTLTTGDPKIFRLGSADNTNTTIASSAAGKTYAVGSNACASANGTNDACASGKLGKISNYSFNVYFRPKAAEYYEGTVTITDGTSTATVTLKGTGVLNDNAIEWSPNTTDKKNWGEQLTLSATATNTDYVNCPITFTSDNPTYATVNGNTVTFNQAGAGQQVTITANQSANDKYKAASLPKTFTIKGKQVLSWQNESAIEINILKGATQTITAVSSQNLPISYESSNSDVLSVDAGGKLTANSVGEATITASQAGNSDYNATSISKTFQVKSKDTPIFTPNWSSTNLKVGDKVTLGVQYVSDGLTGDFKPQNYDSNILGITRNGNTITIEALNAGSSSVTFTQAETDAIFAASQTYSFTVSKIANTLTADATHSMKVDETWSSVISGKNSDGAVTTTSSDETVAYYDVANNKIVAQNTGSQSFNSKEVSITISQAATYKYTAAEKTIKVTVNKHDNHISINGNQDSYAANAFMDGYAQINLTATNTDYAGSPITATQTAGTDIATFYPDDKVVYSTYKLGDATWNVSQPENYKYKAANASFTIHVVKEAEETCNVATSSSTYWAKLGNTTDALTWTDKNAAKDLYFKASISTASTFNSIQVQQQINGNWENVGSLIDGKDNYPDGSKPVVTLSQAATGVRWQIAGSLGSDVTNVRVTRKTYLNASDFTINTQENNTTLVYPGDKGTGSFQVDYSLANGGDLKIACDNSKFTLDKTTQSDVDCKSGSFTVNVTYTSQTAGTDYAHVVIYNNVYRKEITITGITQKHQQTLKWKENFDQMSLGQEVSDAASSSHGVVTYTSYNTDVIRVDNGTTLVAVAKGEANIKATAAGDDEYDEKSIEKTISVTENHVQYIVWTQSLMGLKLGGDDKTLSAYATSEEEEGVASGRAITYTSDNTSVVSVSGNQLKIVGVGTANVTARQEGGNYAGIMYEAVEKVNKVVVKDPSAKCESFVYEQNGDPEEFFAFDLSTPEIKGTEHTLTGEPAKLTFYAKREYWKLGINYSKGNIVVDAYTSSGWQQVLDCGEPPIGSYQEYSVNLNREVTKIRFRRPSGGQGYHYIADAKIEQARYIETTTPATFQANVGEEQQQTITLNYSNITSGLQLSMASGASSHFSVDKTEIDGDCGDVKKNISLTITYTPTANTDDNIDGKETETLIITDGTTQCEVKLYGKAAKVDRDIVWDIADENNAYTVEQIALTATAETKLHQPAGEVAYNIVGASTQGCGTIENKVLSFNKKGIVYVEASTIASDKYNQATNIIKQWTVNLTPTEIVTAPEIDGDIVYGTQLKDLKLKANTGAAQNTVNQQAVEGTFAITSGDLSSAGEHTIMVTFTPTNTDMFATCTKEINVSVLKADPSATASAGDIVYGAKVESSVLTNTGTTEGTWTWNDEQNEQELAVGTHEGLKVHFTPTDQANYNEIDGTVSLTVNKAAATLNWTSAPTEADVKDQLTYSATSNHSESAITYAITEGNDYATIDANTGVLTIIKAGTITVQASQATTDNYEAATITINTTLSGEFESVFNGNGDWNNPNNWTHGVPEGDNPNVVISGSLTINGPISVGGLTIEQNGKVNIVDNGDLTVNGTSEDRETYGNLFVRNGGNITINESAEVKVYDFVVESSIGTTGTSISGQVTNGDKVICTNGAYIDINMDPDGIMDDTQWYGFTVPFPVDVQNGIARKEGDVFRKCTYGVEYFIAEYDMTQRLNSGKGWKYIKSGQLQPGRFYYFTVNGNHNVYSFKAADNTITINNETQLVVNGEGPNANWNAVGNSTLTYTSISGENVPNYVQTYINGESRYITVAIDDAQFVVGCPFFFQAKQEATMVLNKTDETNKMHYAPRQTMDKPICVRIAEEGKHFSDQMYLTASEDALDEYELGLDLAKAGIGTKSAQLWVNAYGLQLCVNNATLINNQAYYNLSVYAPQAGNYELSLPDVPTNGILYLLQDGYPIWNLNESPYTLECAKGTTNEYGLLFVEQEPQAPTGSQTISGNLSAQKILKDQQIYIQKNGTIFTISGQKVK